ncbi:MAG: AarF/ABC1/UbiB kinase family protein [Pirellulales bacterium]|nr:AarF/ABC1/UbiB kinase family protein [Pirellulales bacterium]
MKLTAIPQLYRHSNRAIEVISVLSKYGLANWLSRLDFEFAKSLFKAPDGEALARKSPEVRLRLALTELGPTFIKLGQVLSTRADLVGVAVAEELQRLQSDTPADGPEAVRSTIESELGRPVAELFREFDDRPLASASIGQVHAARLHSGEAVVVKVRHPGVEHKIRVDLEILAGFAQWAESVGELRAYRPRATVSEFQRIVLRELDFGREERNMQQFAADFADDPRIHIPRSYPELCTARVLTMERLDGIKLNDSARLGQAGLDLVEVARRGAELYMTMIFAHGFYHADPHPGNLLLLPGNVIGLLDYGMVGRIDEQLREDIEEMVLAVVAGDAAQLTLVITRVGEVPAACDRSALAVDVADFVAFYTTQRLDEFNLSGALNELTEMIRRYQITLPARVAMLLKVLVMLEGTSRLLSPQFNLLEVMRPHQREMLWRRMSPVRRVRKLRRIYREFEHLVEVLPRGIHEIMDQVQSGKFDVHLDHRGLAPSVNRLVFGMITSALFLGSALMLSQRVPPLVADTSVLGAAGVTLSLILALRLLRAINKSGHLERRNK